MAISGGGNKKRRLLALPGLLVLGASLLTCNIDLSMDPKYSDTGLNWISGFGFDKAPNAASSGWAMGYSASSNDSFDYMGLEATGGTVSETVAGLSPDAAVYRLSIENLFPDGSLSAETAGPAQASASGRWSLGTVDGAPSTLLSADILPAGNAAAMHGQTLSYTRYVAGQFVGLELSRILKNHLAGAGPVAGSGYQVNFLLSCTDGSSSLFYYLGSAAPDQESCNYTAITASGYNDVRVNSVFMDSSLGYSLFLGPQSLQKGYIDDIRVVRRGIDLCLEFGVARADIADLISGRYAFSVWVKDDPDAGELLSSGLSADGRMRADSVTLTMQAEGSTDGGAQTVFARPAGGWTAWTKLAVDAEMALKDSDPESTEPIFSLRLSPANLSGILNPGSVLIAQPELRFLLENT
jgi:hypothetical protein